ncbi:hypothetical protein FRC01_014065 [Tulasnella sp. 417]|nr:hypothetical protein FRC01_014065 [Tulasnella sp. 417]
MTHSDGMNNNPSNASQASGLPDLPFELLKQVISYVPVSSKASFTVNRFIRSICEECLYERINLWGYPRRSLRLLETFVLRPDLALLVCYLTINASSVSGCEDSGQILGGRHFDGAKALSLARNLRYLRILGSDNLLSGPGYDSLRTVIFNMKLSGILIPWCIDPIADAEQYEEEPPAEGVDEEIAEPQLEYLYFAFYEHSDQLLSTLKARLRSSDVPNLKYLEADRKTAIAFIAAASGLESLNVTIGYWNDTIVSQMESISTTSRSSLRRLAIRAMYGDAWLWENFARVFSLFPSLEVSHVDIWTDALDLDSPRLQNIISTRYEFYRG